MHFKRNRTYFFMYTVLFTVMVAAVYWLLWKDGKSFVQDNDSYYQHLHALMYYGKWFRETFCASIAAHRLVLKEWDFAIGFGGNVLTTFHYYCIGDPLALLSAFVPEKDTMYLFGFLVLLRHYLAGITFSCFCFYMGKENKMAVLAATFAYIFSFYAVGYGLMHPFFSNPMIYFPLVLMGVEKILRGGVFTPAGFICLPVFAE